MNFTMERIDDVDYWDYWVALDTMKLSFSDYYFHVLDRAHFLHFAAFVELTHGTGRTSWSRKGALLCRKRVGFMLPSDFLTPFYNSLEIVAAHGCTWIDPWVWFVYISATSTDNVDKLWMAADDPGFLQF